MSEHFGPYEVLETVASGSTGTVYRARHTELERIAAIKELSARLRGTPGMLEQLRSEAETLSRLDHPHVVAVYDYVEEGERAWIAEEWVDGASLEQLLAAHGPLSAEQSLGVVRGAMLGLAHAHDLGLVHRDIAPGNILADAEGTSKLVDFGLAAPVGDTGTQGTPAFMSPEAAAGEPVGKSGDVYSAAAVLYSLLSGRPPFPAGDVATTLRHHRETPPPSLEDQGSELRALVRRSMDKDPAARPQDAREFLEAFEEAARRRFGAGWLARSSIAGAVASAMTVPVAGGAGTGATVAAPTVVVDAATFATGGVVDQVSTAARFSRKQLGLAAAVAAAVFVGGGVAVAGLGGGAGDPGAALEPVAGGTSPSGSVSQEPSDEPSEDPQPTFEELSPSGRWDYKQITVSSDFPGDKPGDVVTRRWTFEPKCGQRQCKGTIKSSSGSVFPYTWDDKLLVVRPPNKGVTITEGLCVDDQTGKEVPGSHFKQTFTYSLSPMTVVARRPDGSPRRLEGTSRGVATYSELSENCFSDGPERVRARTVLTPR